MEFHTFTLPNGIRCIHKQTNGQVSHCGLIINAGSRDELEHEQGLAHFIEHSIFKGTRKRKTFHILNRLDKVGGEINAFTTKEETWIYASFLNAHFERAIELIADICFNSTFPEKEIHKEKEVIIDEINSYLDNPGDTIFEEFEEKVFPDHPLGRNILGTEESVRALGRKEIFDLIGRRYKAGNIVFSSVGNLSIQKIEKLAKKYMNTVDFDGEVDERVPFEGYVPVKIEEARGTHQVHCVMGGVTFGNGDPRKLPMILLNNYLGGPAMNSRLSLKIREKYGFTYNIESHYTAYSDSGLFQIYLGTDQKNYLRTKGLVYKELKILREKRLGPSQLHDAQQQLIGQIALSQESGSGTMMALGKSYLLYNRVDTMKELFHKIEQIKAADILEVANDTMHPDLLSELTYLNGK